MSQAPFRIGAVSFANALPLVDGLEADSRVELLFDLPARLGDQLWEGRLDVGLIPAVEYLRGTGSSLVPGVCIAARGAVKTVKVFSQVPLGEATSIAVDRGSRSSVALLRVLLAERWGHHPDLHVVEPRPGNLFAHHQTVLVIGDRANEVQSEGLHVYDLGEEWLALSGLPFVFAAWALAPDLPAKRQQELIALLRGARDRGLGRLPELAAETARRRPEGAESLLSYWQHSIVYDLGKEELAGLQEFARLCDRHSLLTSATAVSVAEA